jgi:hypothetical protein
MKFGQKSVIEMIQLLSWLYNTIAVYNWRYFTNVKMSYEKNKITFEHEGVKYSLQFKELK